MVTSDLRARVKSDGVEYYLGKYSTPEEARAVERAFKIKHNLPLTRSQIAKKIAATKKEHGYKR